MAELPPLEPLPEGNIPQSLLGQMRHSAEWADTFGGSGTNLSQRYRHNQNITDYAQALSQARAQAQEDLIARDETAQKLYFGQQRLDMQERASRQKLAFDAELHPLKLQAQERAIAATQARERATIRADDFKAKAAEQEAADTEAFHTKIDEGLKSGVRIGTPEYAELVATARLGAPAMSSAFFDDVWKSTTGSKLTPEEAVDQARKMAQARAEGAAAGKPVAQPKAAPTDSYEKLNKEQAEAIKAYKRFRPESEGANDSWLPGDEQKKFDARRSAIRAGEQSPTAAPVAPATTPAPSKTVWKADANGVKWEYDPTTKQPTGKYVQPGK